MQSRASCERAIERLAWRTKRSLIVGTVLEQTLVATAIGGASSKKGVPTNAERFQPGMKTGSPAPESSVQLPFEGFLSKSKHDKVCL